MKLLLQKRINLAEEIMNATVDASNIAYYWGNKQSMTRENLFEKSMNFAGSLEGMGIKANDRVILSLKDTPALPIAILGLVLIGAIPVPINPFLRQEALDYIVSDSGAEVIILEDDFRESLATLEKSIKIIVQDLYLDNTEGSPKLLHCGFRHFVNKPSKVNVYRKGVHEAAFWQYTSGTTGNPKAVQHNAHGMIINASLYAKNVLKIKEGDLIYAAPKMFFGYGLGASFFFPLLLGASCLLDSRWSSPDLIIDNISKWSPNVIFGVPAIYSALLKKKGELKKVFSKDFTFVSAGSNLSSGVFNQWLDYFGMPILDGIGATEVGHVFLSNSPDNYKPGKTGKPISGYEVKIVSTNSEESAPDEQGVLFVRGPSVALGYWNKSKATEDKFSHGWYCTGDLFNVDDDGFYQYLGREDDLFKIKGRWVVPLEIESKLTSEISDISEVAYIPTRDDDDLETGTLLIVPTVGYNPKNLRALEDSVLSLIRNSFESYKYPSTIHFIDALFRNDNGKVDKSHLIRHFSSNK